MICSGLDPSGGAGVVADVRVASELGARPAAVITAQTVQNTKGCAEIHAVDAELVGHQLQMLLSDIEVRAIKIGMLGSVEVARAIAGALQLTAAPVVLDPVLAPTLGDTPPLDLAGAITALQPHLAVLTPNVPELAALTGRTIVTVDDAEAAARAVAAKLDCAVLVTGGHLAGDDAVDLLVGRDVFELLRAPRVAGGEHVHGTGCALSTALAVQLALGQPLVEACRLAKQYVTARLADPARPGQGAAAIV